MMPRLKAIILELLDEHRVMTIATNRPDGWPQATMVSYVNDGYLVYCFIPRNTQKYANLLRDRRVSIAIGSDTPSPLDIKGLSLAGQATEVTDPVEFDYVAKLRLKRFPEYASFSAAQAPHDGALLRILPEPPTTSIALMRITPDIISVLDYSKGFGHSELVTFSERDLDVHLESRSHRWTSDTKPNSTADNLTKQSTQ